MRPLSIGVVSRLPASRQRFAGRFRPKSEAKERDGRRPCLLAQTALVLHDSDERRALERVDDTGPDPSERALVDGLRSGALSAFEDLYRKHAARMKSMAFNLLGNSTDAEDAVQEAFLRVYRHRSSFRGHARLSSWLFRVLINACHDLGRQRRRHRETTDLDSAAPLLPPAPQVDHPLRLTLERGLAGLSDRQRLVFLLFEVEGFRHREIAEILDIAEGTSKYALFEAKRQLQAVVQPARPRAAEVGDA